MTVIVTNVLPADMTHFNSLPSSFCPAFLKEPPAGRAAHKPRRIILLHALGQTSGDRSRAEDGVSLCVCVVGSLFVPARLSAKAWQCAVKGPDPF